MNLPSGEEFKKQIEDQEEFLPSIVEIKNLLWKTTPQLQALLTNDGAPGKGVKITAAHRRFTTQSLTYIRLIYLYCENPEKAKQDIDITYKPLNKPPISTKANTGKFYLFLFISDFCEWFEISSNAKFIKPHITKINVHCADETALAKYSSDITKYIEAKSSSEKTIKETIELYEKQLEDIAEATGALSDLKANIAVKNTEQFEIAGSIDELIGELENKQGELSTLELNFKHTSELLTETKNNHEQLSQQATNLNKNISNLRNTLEKLTEDRNLISDEYGPYVKEGKSQARIYLALATLPLVAIIFSIYEVYLGASKLLLTEHATASDIFAAFLLRIPFAAVFALAIFYSWKLSSTIIQKILKIHNDRLTLAKLLIVAREIVHSSTKNLEISDKDKFQEQVALKVEVLKSHLAKELGEDFKYSTLKSSAPATPSPIESAANDEMDSGAEPVIKNAK